MDEEAATTKKGTALKKTLTLSPFVLEFEYGISGESYWSYQHMVLQVEYCVDVLNTIYPQHDFLCLFDHFCGHDKQREDGLNAENMSKYYGGKQAKL